MCCQGGNPGECQIKTLSWILLCTLITHESLVHTAKKLYIHRNTMIYRLTKATELMNLDLSSGENCFYYLLSIRLLENLEN